LRAKALVEHFDDFRQRRFLVIRFSGSYLGGNFDTLSVTAVQIDGAGVDTLQPVVLKFDFIP
jgi:hypothetical protein